MDITVNDLTEVRKEVVAIFSPEELQQQERDILQTFQRQAKIAGFRPGKAPETMIRTRFGKEIAEELNNSCIRKAYKEGIEQSSLRICAVGNIERDAQNTETAIGSRVRFEVDIQPEFELLNYKRIPVTAAATEVSNEDRESYINRLRASCARYDKVSRPVQKGDYVKVSYTGRIDGKEIADEVTERPIYGTQNNTWEEAGAEDSPGVPTIINGVIGMKVGDKKTFIESYATDFTVPALAGHAVAYEVEVHEVREKQLPSSDEELFKQFNVETEAEFHEKVSAQLQQLKKEELLKSKTEQVIDSLLASYTFSLPELLVNREAINVLQDIVSRQLEAGESQERIESQQADLLNKARAIAQRNVRLRFILLAIAEKEALAPDNNRLGQLLHYESTRLQKPIDKFIAEIKKEPEKVKALRQEVLCRQVIDFLIENASVAEQ